MPEQITPSQEADIEAFSTELDKRDSELAEAKGKFASAKKVASGHVRDHSGVVMTPDEVTASTENSESYRVETRQ